MSDESPAGQRKGKGSKTEPFPKDSDAKSIQDLIESEDTLFKKLQKKRDDLERLHNIFFSITLKQMNKEEEYIKEGRVCEA